ncbi:MAG: ATP-binding protein, partial [Chloroflexota bacterium]
PYASPRMTAETPSPAIDATALLRRARALLVFDGLLSVSPLHELVALLEALACQPAERSVLRPPSSILDRAAEAYGRLFRALADAPAQGESGDPLRAAVVDALLLDENPLSRRAELEGLGQAMAPPLLAAAAADLRTLQALASLGPRLPAVVQHAAGLPEPPPWWDGAFPSSPVPRPSPLRDGAERIRSSSPPVSKRQGKAGRNDGPPLGGGEVLHRLETSSDWGALAEELVAHYATHGSGNFARYRAFRWVGPPDGAAMAAHHSSPITHHSLLPVPVPDAIRPGDLIGYTEERTLLRRNTVQFLAGYPANNVLLYGDRGTGKSSSVKSLLNAAGECQGPDEPDVDWGALRLIEVPKSRLVDFPVIVSLLRGRAQRFILFIDDLSFEEGETEYKDMKAMLEGGIEARPSNVVVYATSNRRHLIREQFADRAPLGSDEVHAQDTVQEKLSFADRFGITITFPTPNQASYLAIVEGLAHRQGLHVAPTVLRARAIEWAAWHNGRSGRTARQLVDHLAGELGLAAQGQVATRSKEQGARSKGAEALPARGLMHPATITKGAEAPSDRSPL